MSARDLEEFIKVIESAEKLSSLCHKARQQQLHSQTEPSVHSVASSYPTDIFPASKSHNREKYSTKDHGPQVPKLWNPKSGSEFLGSSWGSLGSHAQDKTSIRRSSSTSEVRSQSINSSSSRTFDSDLGRTNEELQLSCQSCNIAREEKPEKAEQKARNPLLALQRHSGFGRIQAKDLSPAVTPQSSPSIKRRSRGEGQPATVDDGKAETTSPAVSITSTNGTALRRSRSVSKDSTKFSTTTSAKSNLSEPSSSYNKSPSKPWPHQSGSSDSSSVLEEIVRSESPETPRPPPIPRPRVTIRRNTVTMHVHSKEGEPNFDGVPPRQREKQRPRPRSAPGFKPKPKPKVEPTVDLRSYSKSLKLLGLDIPSNRKEATKLMHYSVSIRTTAPSLRTRLKERTQSVTDLQEIIDSKEYLPQEKYKEIKDPLAKAVFEEWYFRKAAQDVESKRMEAENKEKEVYEKGLIDEEKKITSSNAYKQWLKLKKVQFAKGGDLVKKKSETALSKEEKIIKIKQAEIDWRERKRKEYLKLQKQKRQTIRKLEEEHKLKEEKRAQAEKHFNAWKERNNKTLREKVENAKQLKLLQLEQKAAQAKEKKEEVAAAFAAWKRKKDELTIRHSENKHQTKEGDDHNDKINAARQAYENWLEYVEQRENEERYAEQEHMMRLLWRPPWYPPGIAEF